MILREPCSFRGWTDGTLYMLCCVSVSYTPSLFIYTGLSDSRVTNRRQRLMNAVLLLWRPRIPGKDSQRSRRKRGAIAASRGRRVAVDISLVPLIEQTLQRLGSTRGQST